MSHIFTVNGKDSDVLKTNINVPNGKNKNNNIKLNKMTTDDVFVINKYYDVDAPKHSRKCYMCRQYIPGGHYCPCSDISRPCFLMEWKDFVEEYANERGICPYCDECVVWGYRCRCYR